MAESTKNNGSYIIEREFLAQISITELVSRIIRAHASEAASQEAV